MQHTPPSAHNPAFVHRHIGPSEADVTQMLTVLGYESLDALARAAVPRAIFDDTKLALPAPLSERDALHRLAEMTRRNRTLRSFIGTGYSNCIVPPVIQRNILE